MGESTNTDILGNQAMSLICQPQSRSQPQESCPRKPLPGKRKVWGTMKICPSTTVKSVISQLTCITDTSIQVKRKYKMAESGKVAK